MAKRASKNNVLAGLFVLTSIVLAVATIIVLADLGETLRSTNNYVVRFSLSEGAMGLAEGSPVTLGGQKVGRVSKITFVTAAGDQAHAIDVAIRIRADIPLRTDADVQLVIPLLGSNSQINIVDLGTPSAAPATAAQTIDGTLAPPGFLAQAGYGPEQQTQVQDILTNLSETTAWVNDLRRELETDITTARQRLTDILESADTIMADARTKWPGWSARTDSILATADENLGPFITDARDGIADARRTIGKVEGVIDENRDDVRTTVSNITTMTERLNGELYDDFETMLNRAITALDDFSSTAGEARDLIERYGPEIGLIVANARLASDQLKATTIEVRQAPWRLLYQPGRKEFENELLYDSVRTYAVAVGDLRATAAALREVAETGAAADAADGRTVDQLVTDLQDAFRRYEEAERTFLEQWVGTK